LGAWARGGFFGRGGCLRISRWRMRGALLVLAVVVGLGTVASLLVAWRRDTASDGMRSELAVDLERGSLAGLARAQARARHLIVADPDDLEAVAALAFASAVLAVDYGFDTADEVQKLLARSPVASAHADAVVAMSAAARALLLLARGDRDGAERVATAAAKIAPGAPYPLYALGRARARAGDLPGAARALEAALIEAPGFTLAEVAWSETQLDAGEAQAARDTLSRTLARSGDDPRATLLLGEAERALGSDTPPDTSKVCATSTARRDDASPRWPPPVIRAACHLAQATHDRSAGHRAQALTHAEEAARLVPAEPRLLAATAKLLAELGPVDWAAGLLGRARRLAAAEAPALAWAGAAVDLGRGRTPALPAGPRPADPETRLLMARIALSAGGVGALRAALKAFDENTMKRDADLSLLAQLFVNDSSRDRARDPRDTSGSLPPVGTTPPTDPWRAYLDGLRAELAGNLPDAAASFGRALSGHGDACRAAGEYLATLRLLKRPQDSAASGKLTVLRAENAGCVNLR